MILPGRAFFIALALLSSAVALDLSSLKPQGFVSDYAYVVDAESRRKIELYCARLQKATGAQIAIVTLQSVEGQPVEEIANDLFHRWGVGKKGEDNGLLFLLVTNERRSRLEVGRGLEPIITDGSAGNVLREMRPALRESRYGEALWIAATSLGEVIAQAKGVQMDMGPGAPQRARPAAPQPVYDGIPWPILIGGLFILMMIIGKGGRGRRGGGMGGGFLPGLVLGNMMGGGRSAYGGSAGGGFGGYDSGDTFSGFGGGDSGGGGASSNW